MVLHKSNQEASMEYLIIPKWRKSKSGQPPVFYFIFFFWWLPVPSWRNFTSVPFHLLSHICSKKLTESMEVWISNYKIHLHQIFVTCLQALIWKFSSAIKSTQRTCSSDPIPPAHLKLILDPRIFCFIGVTGLITLERQQRPWVLGTLIYEVKLETGGRSVQTSR